MVDNVHIYGEVQHQSTFYIDLNIKGWINMFSWVVKYILQYNIC
jgi:hypothetical protein